MIYFKARETDFQNWPPLSLMTGRQTVSVLTECHSLESSFVKHILPTPAAKARRLSSAWHCIYSILNTKHWGRTTNGKNNSSQELRGKIIQVGRQLAFVCIRLLNQQFYTDRYSKFSKSVGYAISSFLKVMLELVEADGGKPKNRR